MKTFTKAELNEILAQHKLWRESDCEQGKRADLSGANLTRADLIDADLSSADLIDANLIDANLTRANLTSAYLTSAYLTRADLIDADLSSADLIDANLTRANLTSANLTRANLTSANLSGADLSGANLSGAYLTSANLSGADLTSADLSGADLSGAYLPDYALCPEEGDFIGYKKLQGGVVAKLRIPAEAARTSSLVGRKCRAEFVEVLELSGGVTEAASEHNRQWVYRVGEIVRPDKYDSNPAVECTNGIHFFITRKEAEGY